MADVYLLGDAGRENCFKIGMTRGKINKRIKQLQTGNGGEIYLVDYFETEYPFFIERSMHMKFFNKHTLNEWYELNTDDITNFKEYCQLYEDNAKSLKNNHFANNILK